MPVYPPAGGRGRHPHDFAHVSPLRNSVFWGALAVVLAIVAALYYWQRGTVPATEQPVAAAPASAPAQAQAPPASEQSEGEQIQHPLPQVEPEPAAQAQPLPPLSDSDAVVGNSLASVLGAERFADVAISEDLVRRIVSTIDNLPRKHVAKRLIPLQAPAGALIAERHGEVLTLSARNYARYTRYVRLAVALDAHRVVGLYVRFYPLFQQAYQELGYPRGWFNDRLIAVIDHLLATPEMRDPIELTRSRALYVFADPQLEDLSAGQKVLLRIGPDNAALLKVKLRELRRELVAEAPTPGA